MCLITCRLHRRSIKITDQSSMTPPPTHTHTDAVYDVIKPVPQTGASHDAYRRAAPRPASTRHYDCAADRLPPGNIGCTTRRLAASSSVCCSYQCSHLAFSPHQHISSAAELNTVILRQPTATQRDRGMVSSYRPANVIVQLPLHFNSTAFHVRSTAHQRSLRSQ